MVGVAVGVGAEQTVGVQRHTVGLRLAQRTWSGGAAQRTNTLGGFVAV